MKLKKKQKSINEKCQIANLLQNAFYGCQIKSKIGVLTIWYQIQIKRHFMSINGEQQNANVLN